MEPERPRRFSMLRDFSLADLITLANGCCGTGSVLAVMQYLTRDEAWLLDVAFALLPFAMVFDFLDGRVARWRRRSTPLGAQLDSLADLISFGVAPACIGFAVGLRGALDAFVLVYFVSCGLSRLARYNATASALADESGKVAYYEGTPIPTSLLLVLGAYALWASGRVGAALPLGSVQIGGLELHWLSLAFAASGSAMISKTLRVPKP